MFFKRLPFHLLVCLIFTIAFGDMLPFNAIRAAYTISCVFKELLLAFLPLVIFSYISTAFLSLDKRAPFLIFGIIGLVVFSNGLAVWISYGAARALLPLIPISSPEPVSFSATASRLPVLPYFSFSIPRLINADTMMLIALAFGWFFSLVKVPQVTRTVFRLQQLITHVLVKGFIPFLPLYILGFALKIQYEGALSFLLQKYTGIFLIMCGVVTGYLVLAYAVGTGFRLKPTFIALQNMLPAGLTGFSTMSSAVTMPVTLASAQKNIENADFVQLVIPTTVNIHMVGDALSLPLLTFGVMWLFGQPLPSFDAFFWFVPAFCLAKFSLAAIPGGTIIVMLPVLQAHFHLSPEIASLITTLYILQDPFFTCSNVMGNGAFAMISYKLFKQVEPKAKWLEAPSQSPH
jgi:Na+/H+-dicarboxylate symporter